MVIQVKVNNALDDDERFWLPRICKDLEFMDLYGFFRWMTEYKAALLAQMHRNGWPSKSYEETWDSPAAEVMNECLRAMEELLYGED